MAHILIVALSTFLAVPPAPSGSEASALSAAPVEGADARYCLRVAPIIGTRVEAVRCWTRQQWADLGVDVDQEWEKEGVAIRK